MPQGSLKVPPGASPCDTSARVPQTWSTLSIRTKMLDAVIHRISHVQAAIRSHSHGTRRLELSRLIAGCAQHDVWGGRGW